MKSAALSTRYATGGMSNLIALETDMIEIIDPILTLEGLSIIARLNGLV